MQAKFYFNYINLANVLMAAFININFIIEVAI